MSAGEIWLSLKVIPRADALETLKKYKPAIYVSVPKKILPLASRRNRLKRLIREAIRGDVFFMASDRKYWFKVLKRPDMESLKMKQVRDLIQDIKKRV